MCFELQTEEELTVMSSGIKDAKRGVRGLNLNLLVIIHSVLSHVDESGNDSMHKSLPKTVLVLYRMDYFVPLRKSQIYLIIFRYGHFGINMQ